MELGPDGWVSEKPWARELAIELGLGDQLLPSNDAERVTWVLHNGSLQALPEGMRMMVPTRLESLKETPLFSAEARAAFAAEPARADALKRAAPEQDESVASFVRRHFGDEVLRTIGAPLLGGIFGGDVEQLSVRAVMQPFVAMEREDGSLILALQRKAQRPPSAQASLFTSLRAGTGALAEAMIATLDLQNVQLHRRVTVLARPDGGRWQIATEHNVRAKGVAEASMTADHVLLALPVLTARELLRDIDPRTSDLMHMHTSSAAVVAFGFLPEQEVQWPKGFGFLVPPGSSSGGGLLAATFCDQKYAHRAPAGARLIRAYYGGLDLDRDGGALPLWAMRSLPYEQAFTDLERVLGALPSPAFSTTRLWHRALPQYAVGHVDRMAELDARVATLGSLHLLGNGYRGVGLPDLIRDARAAARSAAE